MVIAVGIELRRSMYVENGDSQSYRTRRLPCKRVRDEARATKAVVHGDGAHLKLPANFVGLSYSSPKKRAKRCEVVILGVKSHD